jgi:hypothetical protein
MNRLTSMAFAALVLAVGGAWLKLRAPEQAPPPASRPPVPAPASLVRVKAPPAPVQHSNELVAPPPVAPIAVTPAHAVADAGAGAYDDAHLYRRESVADRLPPTAQGVLVAFDAARPAVATCLENARRQNPALTSLMSLEVRIAAQDDGTAAVEEVRLPSSNDPSLSFRGCLVAALADHRFDVPDGGSTRLSLPINLASRAP